ncbi:Sodium/calcium exchanger protein-domain-containing protein [Aspergillus caelatus]|uniref:Sodium/calcium exchanger protein-domain-containing protein n=2 Tax=Aspergillus subgen. Circumdati TaxID=2720871 RepID=A0A5N6ZZS1_9EURO|nr:Sodium/calcium exchanger protein-domain-containing protein [Aspergillus caelatus]KAE8362818.1 Sodium/calcium exchanger protein-domain-containing protein [Aspergillus caelatus]KAE8417267.1 Sodium/calcium exchanger protein-domain-containing protein [Aspergillus pseudocaelatus]
MNWDRLLFNAAVFAAGVLMLDYGADKFIDHTVIIGQRLGVSQTLIAVLTAGAEYEELAVVIAAVLQKQSPLAIGNVMGSTISNILGAFSLGLLLHPGPIDFDRSAKVYTALLLSITTAFSILAYFNMLNKITGGVLMAIFLMYTICTCYAIHKGVMEPPEASDSDSDNDTNDDEHSYLPSRPQGNIVQDESETSPLLTNEEILDSRKRAPRSLFYHISQLIMGLLALTISGYLLSRSASVIADCFHLSGTVVGLTVVSFATTLPEKMVAIISGSRGHSGIVVASTAGSNIFLLTLCAGVIALAGLSADKRDRVLLFELFSTWISSVMLFLAVFVRASRAVGALFLVMYVAFLILEFTVYRR